MTNPGIVVSGIRSVLEEVRSSLPAQNVLDANELLDHAEWGEAFSLICTQLYEYDVAISRRTYDQIEWLGQQMRLESKEWSILEELVQ